MNILSVSLIRVFNIPNIVWKAEPPSFIPIFLTVFLPIHSPTLLRCIFLEKKFYEEGFNCPNNIWKLVNNFCFFFLLLLQICLSESIVLFCGFIWNHQIMVKHFCFESKPFFVIAFFFLNDLRQKEWLPSNINYKAITGFSLFSFRCQHLKSIFPKIPKVFWCHSLDATHVHLHLPLPASIICLSAYTLILTLILVSINVRNALGVWGNYYCISEASSHQQSGIFFPFEKLHILGDWVSFFFY